MYKIVDKYGNVLEDEYSTLVEAEYIANTFIQLFGDGFEVVKIA